MFGHQYKYLHSWCGVLRAYIVIGRSLPISNVITHCLPPRGVPAGSKARLTSIMRPRTGCVCPTRFPSGAFYGELKMDIKPWICKAVPFLEVLVIQSSTEWTITLVAVI